MSAFDHALSTSTTNDTLVCGRACESTILTHEALVAHTGACGLGICISCRRQALAMTTTNKSIFHWAFNAASLAQESIITVTLAIASTLTMPVAWVAF